MNVLDLLRNQILTKDSLKDLTIKHYISKLPQMTFEIPKELKSFFKEEFYIQIEGEGEYIIKECSKSGNKYNIVAKPNVDDLFKDFYSNYYHENKTLFEIVNPLITPYGWNLVTSDTKRQIFTGKDKVLYEMLIQAFIEFETEFIFDINTKTIYAEEKLGRNIGTFLSKEINLRELNITSQSYDLVTRLVPKGKDSLGIEGVNNGLAYVEPTVKYTNKVVYGIWKDERYTVAENLKTAAQKKIDQLGTIYKSYEADIMDLYALNKVKYNFLELRIADTITIIDDESKELVPHRIVEYEKKITNPIKSKVVLSNSPLSIQAEQEERQKETDTKIEVNRQYIEVLKGEITLKVSKETYDLLEQRVTSAEIRLEPDKIIQTVTGSTAYQDDLKRVEDKITNVKNSVTLDLNNYKISSEQKFVDVNGKINSFQNYFRYDLINNYAEIGATNSNFWMRLSNTMLAFYESGNIIAYLSNQKLFIKEVVITEAMTFGNHKTMKSGTKKTIFLSTGGVV